MQIETGKYYKAEDGSKVGPMVKWIFDSEHLWQSGINSYDIATSVFNKFGDLWRNDGTSEFTGVEGQLIEEWKDTTPEQDAIDTLTALGYTVTKPEPREFWLYRDGGDDDFNVKDTTPRNQWNEVIHVREVMPTLTTPTQSDTPDT